MSQREYGESATSGELPDKPCGGGVDRTRLLMTGQTGGDAIYTKRSKGFLPLGIGESVAIRDMSAFVHACFIIRW